MNDNTLLLIDGYSYLYRAFHALPSLSNSQGLPTGAVYGMTKMLKNVLTEYQPQYAAVVFDTAGKTFRKELYPLYKAQRPPMPEPLVTQVPWCHQMTQALGFPIVLHDGVEADDVIGTLAKQAEALGMHTWIFSGDKDFAQLVNQSIILIDVAKNVRLDVQGVTNKFGVPPALIIDYLTLTGDSADNVPGVANVGPKTAVRWLTRYGSLEKVMAKANDVQGKAGNSLREALPHLPLSRQLVTIKCDVPLLHTPKELKVTAPLVTQLRQLFSQLEFRQWLKELPTIEIPLEETIKPVRFEEGEDRQEKISNTSSTLLTQSEFDHWLLRLQHADLFAVAVQTPRVNYLDDSIIGISLALSAEETAYIPLAHDYLGAPSQLPRDEVLATLKPLLENSKQLKIGHHLKYDAHVLANHGIDLQGIAYDTLLESYVLDSTASHDLDSLATQHLQRDTTTLEQLAGKGKKQLVWNQMSVESATLYAIQSAEVTWRLHHCLGPKLQVSSSLSQIFQKIEMPLVPVLLRMERLGVYIDATLLHTHSMELASQLQTLEQRAYELAGSEFNLNSPKQLQTILFDQLKLPILKRTPKKEPSTDVEVLEELALDYELPRLVLEYRSVSKLKSTYTDALPSQIHPRTMRIHTSYQQAVTVTGRLSSSSPNLQNIPIRTPEGRRIRQAFIAPKGYLLLAADYSQIELRIMAHLSQDKKLLTAFASGEDVHQATAAEVFGVPINQVTAEQRRHAKAVNFGLMYGMQAFGLAKQLGIGRSAAQRYMDAYFNRYTRVQRFMEETREVARQQGYVETVLGRRLYIPNIHSRQFALRQYAERTAINAPMQGTAADIIKLAMIRIDDWIQTTGLKVNMVMQVHDELVFEVAEEIAAEVKKTVSELMSEVVQLTVPLVVDVGVGKNWEEAH